MFSSSWANLAQAVSLNISNGMPASNVLGQATLFDGADPNRPVSGSSLTYPYQVAFDADHNRLFVIEGSSHRVLIFDLSGGIQNNMSATHVLGQTSLSGSATGFENPAAGCVGPVNACNFFLPYALAYDRTHQRLFVGDYGGPRVLVFDLSGGIQNGMAASRVLGQTAMNIGAGPVTSAEEWVPFCNAQNPAFGCDTDINACGFGPIWSLDYDEAGQRLFVADTFNSRVLVFDLSGGIQDGMAASRVLGQPDMTYGCTDWPSCNSAINTPNPDLGCAVGSNACGFTWPMSVAYDPVSHQLFVGEQHDRIAIFELAGGIINGMPASHVLGRPSLTYDSRIPIGPNSIYYPKDMALDVGGRRLYAIEWWAYGTRVLIWDIASGITDGMNAAWVLGQPDFLTMTHDTACGGGSAGAVNPCGYGYLWGVEVDERFGRLFVIDMINSRLLVYGLSVSGIPVIVGGTNDNTDATAAPNPDGSTTVTVAGQYGVTLPAGTAPAAGNQAIVINTVNVSGRTAVQVQVTLPAGTTKSVVLPIGSTQGKKVCIKDKLNAQFGGGGTCVNGNVVALPQAGTCADYVVDGVVGDNPNNPSDPKGRHTVQVCLNSASNQITLNYLKHTVIETVLDSDDDGVLDDEDLCPNTNLNGPIPTVSLRAGNMGDGQTIFGCNASQILECKPGNNGGETKYGLTPGSQNVFINGTGWAANCHR